MDTRKRTLIVFGIGIVGYGAWTSFLSVFSLIAESGGKDSNPWLAVGVLWPLVELIRSWVWINRYPDQYAISRFRGLGNGLVAGAMVASPLLTFLSGPLFWDLIGPLSWQLGVAVPGLITVIACWAARDLWSRPKESSSGSILHL